MLVLMAPDRCFMSKVLEWRRAIQKSDLPAMTRLVLLNLSIHMDSEGGSCFPSTAKQAADTGLSQRTVCTHLKRAAEAGYIDKMLHGYSGKGWAHNQYKALIPEGTERRSAPQSDNQMQGTEPNSVPAPEGTERGDIKALNDVQSNSSLNSTKKEAVKKSQPEHFYAGEIIKLNEKTFQKWKTMTGLSTDVLAEQLDGRDKWLIEQPEGRKRDWFFSTENHLKRRYVTTGE